MTDNNRVNPMEDRLFIQEIKLLITQAREKAYAAINSAMVEVYWQMGKRIVEEEQQGKERADYGTQLLKELSKELTKEFGKGFSTGSLYYYRQFYLTFPEIFATPWRILSWSHYKRLMQVSNQEARNWYLKEAQEQMWSYRTLDRNIGSQYYECLLLSQKKDKVEAEMKALTSSYQQDKLEFIKNPTVAEFIGLSPNSDFSDSNLESAIIANLQKFLLELDKVKQMMTLHGTLFFTIMHNSMLLNTCSTCQPKKSCATKSNAKNISSSCNTINQL